MYEISIENYKLVILTTLAVLALKWPATSKDPRGSTAFENWRMKGDSKKKKSFSASPIGSWLVILSATARARYKYRKSFRN